MTQVTCTKGSFTHQQTQCAATLHKPQPMGPSPRPTILMVHGWGGTQLMLVKHFISAFNDAGFCVITFDYPGWGDSEGLSRNAISPWQREKVVESALSYAKSLPEVDETNLLLWGTSFGGGHVVSIAAKHPELRGAIVQVPMLDGLLAVKAVPLARQLRFGVDIMLDILNPFGNRYIPIIAEAGGYASMDRDGAWRVQEWIQTHLGQPYDNRVAARSLATMGFYRPLNALKKIRIPMLVIGATRDTVAPFDEKKIKQRVSENVEIHVIDANHFDPYLDPWFENNIRIQLNFATKLIAR